ncbi:MAG: formylglycine-generating enzyme family protein [Candidatus Thiodiazotropha sp.]|jgi:formylglycine-generating enzyme required for sulfatase activity
MNEVILKLLQRLPELDARLRAAGFSVSPDRWQSVYDLIHRLDWDKRLPDEADQLALLLAPLFCNNKVEQQSFYGLFRHWVAGDFAVAESSAQVVHRSALAHKQQQAYQKKTRFWPWFWVTLVLLTVTGVAVYFATWPPEPTLTPPKDAQQTLEKIAGQARDIKPPDEGAKPVELQPVPPRRPAEPVVLDAMRQGYLLAGRYLLTSLPLILLIVWLLNRLWRKRVVLRFHRNQQNDPLMYLKLRHSNTSLPFGWGEFFHRLKRGGSMTTRKLDIEKTIDKTIHRAGLFTPVMLTRDPQPAYLVLMNRIHRLDHTADRAQTLIDRLEEANVTVYRFEYQTDPRNCYSTGQSRKVYSLGQLSRHYAGCRLLLIGDGEGLLDPFSGTLQRWVRLFETWETRVLLTPAPQPWDAREAQIAHSGFAVAPFQVNGLEAVSEWLLKPSLGAGIWYAQEGSDPVPELFTQDEAEWCSSAPPQDYDAEQVCTTLYEYLGQSGYRLLSACAVYPQLVSVLTLSLDQLLYPGDSGTQREQRLVRLSRLPWFREGRIPDYLRRDLLKRVAKPVLERINDAYRQIFDRVSDSPGQQRTNLPFITRRTGGYRAYIRDLVRFAPAGTPMADSLFADVLFGGRQSLLDYVLPKQLARWLPGKRYRLWPVVSTAAASALLVAAVQVGWIWASPAMERLMLQKMRAANGAINLSIATHEETRTLGDALEQALRARGFNQITRQYAKPLSDRVRLDSKQRGEIIQTQLTREFVRTQVAKARKALQGQLDKLFKSTRAVIRIEPGQLTRYINDEFADSLQQRLIKTLASDEVDLADQTMIRRVVEQQISVLIGELETELTRQLKLFFSQPGVGLEQRGFDNKTSGFIRANSGDIINPEVEAVKILDEATSIIRTLFSQQLTQDLVTIAEPIAKAYREALNQALEKAGEDRRSIPDAIVYLPGHGRVAEAIRERLIYLTYGTGDYQLIAEPGSLLESGQSPLHLSINLSRPLVAGGAFRDRLQIPLQQNQVPKEQVEAADQPVTPIEPEMVQIPAGRFLMGSPASETDRYSNEGPQHEVTLRAFALGKTEVPFDEYDRFARATGRELPDDEGWGRGKRPVINVSWNDAPAYAQWLSEETGKRYRLPTEAEWEYAARAGTTTPFSTGECITTDQANYDGNYDYAGCGAKTWVDRGATLAAGSLPPNPWGLHEVHGNVWEWVQDCWHDNYEGAPKDGAAWETDGDCTLGVVRGGDWDNTPENLRSANRLRVTTYVAYSILAFRLARTL